MFSVGDQLQSAFFKRLAITEAQVYQLGLPTRPTKQTDSRARPYSGGSVEVDAIRPTVLRDIVEDAITQHIDPQALRLTQVAGQSERDVLAPMIGTTA